jgi:hypothetical protein
MADLRPENKQTSSRQKQSDSYEHRQVTPDANIPTAQPIEEIINQIGAQCDGPQKGHYVDRAPGPTCNRQTDSYLRQSTLQFQNPVPDFKKAVSSEKAEGRLAQLNV